MFKTLTIAICLCALLAPLTASAWNWQPSPRGFYTNQVINGVGYGITVFYSAGDYYGGAGWRVAFDNQSFYNFGYQTAELAVAAAVEIAFYYLRVGHGLPNAYQGVVRR